MFIFSINAVIHFLRVRALLASPVPGHCVQTLTLAILYTHRNDDKERRGQSVQPFSLRDATPLNRTQ